MFAINKYKTTLNSLLGKTVRVYFIKADKNVSFRSGYIEELTTLDDEFQDAYYVGKTETMVSAIGLVAAIMYEDNGKKATVIVTNEGENMSEEQLRKSLFNVVDISNCIFVM